jgi:hypothetical protein
MMDILSFTKISLLVFVILMSAGGAGEGQKNMKFIKIINIMLLGLWR